MRARTGPSLLQALFDALMPSVEADPQLRRSFVVLHMVGPLFGMPVCAALLVLDSGSGPIALVFTAGVCLFWALPLIARVDLGHAAFLSVQLLTLVSLFGAFFYGGLNSPFAVWLIVAVLLGFLYLPRNLLRWALVMAVQVLLFIAARQVWLTPPRLGDAELGVLFLASAFAAALYVSLVATFYSRIKIEGSVLAQVAVRYDESASRTRATITLLEQDDRRASEFMARISHELRTSLDVVIGYTELLTEDAAAEGREVDERYLARITRSSRQLLARIADGDRLTESVVADLILPSDEKDFIGTIESAPTSPMPRFLPLGLSELGTPVIVYALVALAAVAAALLVPGSAAALLQAVTILIIAGLLLRPNQQRDTPTHLDPLTGLPNRAAFWRELEVRLTPSSRVEAALLFADLDGFKEVNDSLGHDTGDQLLAKVAKRFARACPSNIVLARLGGDEFGAVAFGPGAETAIRNFAENLLNALVEPVRTDEHHLTIGVSIGVAHGQAGQVSAKELLRRSDVAMYRAKQDKRTPVQAFDIQMDETLNFRRAMRKDLAEALSDDQLDLHLQPVVDARTGEPASVEALLRWTHPILGPVPPAKLIALAEESGQIVDIDDWVLERALTYSKRLGALPIAVNISPVQFRQPGFVQKIVGRLAAHAVPAHLLRLEITEGVLITHTRAAERAIAELRAAGVKIALDDFGTGYSSLSYLKDFGFDLLKVDRSFVMALDQGRQGAELLRAIVDLGHSLSMSVIAEGVETAEQSGLVQLLGCDFIQGYFTGRPMSIDQLETWLRELSLPLNIPSSASSQGCA